MFTVMLPSTFDLHNALGALEAAARPDEINEGASALTIALGMERYVLMSIRGATVTSLYHNAPPELSDEVTDLRTISVDPIRVRARETTIPVIWQSGSGGAWRDQHAALGYRSGIAAASWDADGSGRIIMFSCSAECIPDGQVDGLMRYSLVAATAAALSLQRIAVSQQGNCPLTERELECLLYVAAGIPAKKIARALGISVRTVTQYLERVRAKLQVKNSNAAAILAIRNGWLDIQAALDLLAA